MSFIQRIIFISTVIIYLFPSNHSVQAQTEKQASPKVCQLSGFVIDSETSERLSGAHIRVGSNTAVSNNYGYFSVKVESGTGEINTSYTGYIQSLLTAIITHDTVITIALKPGVELDEITVTAPQRHIGSSGLGNARINLSQVYLSPLFLGERDVIKSIQMLPGVSGGMEGSSNVVIRGGTYDQTLFLMDDVPVYSQNHTFGFFSIFNSDALLSADIYKGGIPVLYGNRMSGVASVALKDGNMNTHHGSASIGLLASSLSIEGPVARDKVSFLLTARHSFVDWLMQGLMSLTSDNDYSAVLLSFWDVNGKLTWKIADGARLSASVYTGKDNLGVENKSMSYNEEEHKDTQVYDRFGRGWKNTTASLRLTSSIGRNSFLSSSMYYSQLDNFDDYRMETGNFTLFQQKAMRLQETGWRTSFERRTGNSNTLFAGFDASYQHYRPEILVREGSNGDHLKMDNYPKLRLVTASLFAGDEWRRDRWTVAPGLRVSNYNTAYKNKVAIEPRIKVSYQANDNNRLMAAFDRMSQPVHSINEMVYSESSDYWLPFREERLPVSNQLSAGWKNTAINNLSLSVEAYYKRMQNIVHIQNMESYMGDHSGYRAGSGSSKGLELSAQYTLKRLNAMLSYTLSKTDRTFDGRTVPFKYDAPHDVEFFVGYEVYRSRKRKNRLSLNMQYRSGFPYVLPVARYPGVQSEAEIPGNLSGESHYTWFREDVDRIGSEPNIRLNDFFRADLNFTSEKKMKRGTVVWQFSILNVTARNNPYNVYRYKDRYKAFVLVPFLPSLSVRREF